MLQEPSVNAAYNSLAFPPMQTEVKFQVILLRARIQIKLLFDANSLKFQGAFGSVGHKDLVTNCLFLTS